MSGLILPSRGTFISSDPVEDAAEAVQDGILVAHGGRLDALEAALPPYPLGKIGYAEVTTAQTGITTITDLTGLSVTVDVPAGRCLKITGHGQVRQNASLGTIVLFVREGSTTLGKIGAHLLQTTERDFIDGSVKVDPSAGSHTYKLSALTTGGNMDWESQATEPNYILIEDIGLA